jgi:hypothetical protein
VTTSGYRFDRFDPQVYVTRDFGRSWQSLAGDLPPGPVNVIAEHHAKPGLLFLGNDRGVYFSIDGGQHWNPLRANMATVPVKDLLVHEREEDLVVATYGRGLYVADVAPLADYTPDVLRRDVHFFDIQDGVVAWSERRDWGAYHLPGDRHLRTENEPAGLRVDYLLGPGGAAGVEILVSDASGAEIARLEGSTDVGLNRVWWQTDARGTDPVSPGTYTITLVVDGERHSRRGVLHPAPRFPIGPVTSPAREP